MTDRPQRAEVSARYDLGVDTYVELWSPVILPPAIAVVAALDLATCSVVLDVGTGSGALVPHIREAAPGATIVGVDASGEMLRAARDTTPVRAVQGDAMALPVRSESVDAALLAFVLFHLADPAAAMADVTRVLAGGGRVGTVTWIREDSVAAYDAWDRVLTDAGAPAQGITRVDNGLDSADGIAELLRSAGLETTAVWTEDLHHEWEAARYWRLATGSGVNRMRLAQLDDATRADALERGRARLAALPAEAYRWHGQVLCAIGTKRTGGGSSRAAG